jgi:hypothetical protein
MAVYFLYLRIRAGGYFARVRQVLECCGGVHHRHASGSPTTAAAAVAVAARGLVVFTILNTRREYEKKLAKENSKLRSVLPRDRRSS